MSSAAGRFQSDRATSRIQTFLTGFHHLRSGAKRNYPHWEREFTFALRSPVLRHRGKRQSRSRSWTPRMNQQARFEHSSHSSSHSSLLERMDQVPKTIAAGASTLYLGTIQTQRTIRNGLTRNTYAWRRPPNRRECLGIALIVSLSLTGELSIRQVKLANGKLATPIPYFLKAICT